MNFKSAIKRYPVISYFCLAFLISWGGCILFGGGKFLNNQPMEIEDTMFMGLAMLAGPCLGGITLTYLTEGKEGLQSLLSRLAKWKIQGKWYAVLLIFPLLIVIVLLVLSHLFTPDLTPTFFPIGILLGLMAGFFEETGWMGFVYPRLRSKRSFLYVCILLGFLHALWHIVADFLSNYHDFGGFWLPNFLSFSVFVVALRIIIAWVYDNTGSLFLSQMIHGSSSGFLAALVPMGIPGKTWFIFYSVYALTLWITAVSIIIRNNLQKDSGK
jgi:membrane protease YdiL (CAAX protease family)